MIDYRLLEALAAVIETGGFERAAEQLHLTQSAISQRIRQLETLQGQPVLIRTQPPVATELGRRLNNHLQQVRLLEQDLTQAEQPLNIRLTANADSMATWLPDALGMAESSHRFNFDLIVEDQDIGLKRMRDGEVMACICAQSQSVNGGRVQALGVLRYRALASPSFIHRHNLIDNAALAQAPCLIFNHDDRLQHRFLADQGHAGPGRVHRCPTSEGFVRMALAGLGFGMMPELQVTEAINQGELVDIRQGYSLDVPLYWHYWQTESDALAELRHAVTQQASRVLRPISNWQ
ncbi:transcriptional regulator ArgP [Saccharospirillum sp. MSK14-1]|uniref:LysR family transcriptional regulator ArgP n=1 Tax=Saccharospirillum sp. MSK14-1 TaxID=1897632 RepID=UPI000D33F51A|nr:LysR family transcriptional regulator ArgP [Saccharospirillum sp. MSK14-1]PTY35898.1 transcriptional regulator ArgP [Saccharospirillum sp. MSK14-1]